MDTKEDSLERKRQLSFEREHGRKPEVWVTTERKFYRDAKTQEVLWETSVILDKFTM